MMNRINGADRDEVLFAFHQAYERPTAEQIMEWTNRYPQFAEDIRAHAAVAWDWAAQPNSADQEVDEIVSARAFSQALNLMYKAEVSSAASEKEATCRSFQQMVASVGKETYQLAREIDVGRGVLADLFNGWMRPPIRQRLLDALLEPLQTTREEFAGALNCALQQPYLGHAKADQAPVVTQRSCDEIIRDSNMSQARKRYWLEED